MLLILAGVAIVTLTGENGILTQAGDAKTQTTEGEEEEQIKLGYAEYLIAKESGEQEGLKVEGAKVTEIDKAWKIKFNKSGNEYNFDGKTVSKVTTPSFNPETLTIGEAINTDKYGWEVTNYTVTTSEFTTGVWRLFYQDSNYTYLIADECIGTYNPSDYYSNYTEVGTVGQKLNAMVSSLFTNTDWVNVKATAWLTDTSATSIWNAYKNDDVVFAIRKSNSRIICSIL